MGRVEYTQDSPGGSRAVTNANATFAELATQSTALSRENFAEEGLDRRVFGTDPSTSIPFTLIFIDGTQTITPPTSFDTLVIGPRTFRSGAITLVANESMRLRFRCGFLSTSGTPGLQPSKLLQMRWGFQVTGGGVAGILASTRFKEPGPTSTTDGTFGSLCTTTVLVGPLTLDFVEVQIQYTPSGAPTDVQFESAVMWGTTFHLVS